MAMEGLVRAAGASASTADNPYDREEGLMDGIISDAELTRRLRDWLLTREIESARIMKSRIAKALWAAVAVLAFLGAKAVFKF